MQPRLFLLLASVLFTSFAFKLDRYGIGCVKLQPETLYHSMRWKPQHIFSSLQNNDIPPIDATKPMRVLLCVEPTPFNYISGYANRFKEMLNFMKKAGDEVHAITPDNDPKAPEQYNEYPISSIPGGPFPVYKLVTVSMDFKTRTIPKVIKSFKPDIIHASMPSLIGIASLFWAKRFKIPIVLSYHTDLVTYAETYLPIMTGLARWFVRFMLNKADLALCTSPQVQQSLVNIGVERVDLWRKGINTEIFNPSFKDPDMRNYLSQGNPDHPLLLYVGRIGSEKRLHRMKKVLDANPGARLAIVGHGPAEESIKEVLRDCPVFFAGKLEGEALSKAYASSDIFVMPSDSETLGFVVMEAKASGLPVVGVAAGGVMDIIESGSTGFLAENNEDMMDFSARVKQLIENQDLKREMGNNAIKWAKNWSWESATSVLRNIQYQKAKSIFATRDKRGRVNPDEANKILQLP